MNNNIMNKVAHTISCWFINLIYSLACVNMSKNSSPKRAQWRISGSNRWPLACHASALANWANPPYPKQVVPGRLELPTSTLSVWRSNQLSYRTVQAAWVSTQLLSILYLQTESEAQEAEGFQNQPSSYHHFTNYNSQLSIVNYQLA